MFSLPFRDYSVRAPSRIAALVSSHSADRHGNSDKTICLSVWWSMIRMRSGTIQSGTNRCHTKSFRRRKFGRTNSRSVHLDRWFLQAAAFRHVNGHSLDSRCSHCSNYSHLSNKNAHFSRKISQKRLKIVSNSTR